MSRLLIKVRKVRWQKALPSFVAPGDITADCLMDLNVTENSMSVWELTENDANLKRVLTALAANREFAASIDYLIFDAQIPARLALKLRHNPGNTPDKGANEAWHRDLVEISGRKLAGLASDVFHRSEPPKRCSEKDIVKMLKEAVERNEIDRSKLNDKLLREIQSGPLSLPVRVRRMLRHLLLKIQKAWH